MNSRPIALAVIVLIIVFILAAVLTLSVQPDLPPESGAVYPYTTTYQVLLPDGQPIAIAGTTIIVLTVDDELFLRIGDQNEKFVVGQTKTISERKAVFRSLGFSILSTNYRIDTTYLGRSGDRADFFLIIRTSRQVPSFLIDRILPGEIRARPV
ncbi:MAG: hypothetical protein WC382_13035 [Methanoregulaceae archaeon]|jgi:hypothetical protein